MGQSSELAMDASSWDRRSSIDSFATAVAGGKPTLSEATSFERYAAQLALFEGGEQTTRADDDVEECIAAWQFSNGHQSPWPPLPPLREAQSSGSREVAQGAPSSTGKFGPVLVINVGGQTFRTTASTLRRAPFFESMLRHVEEGAMGTTVDDEGSLFVDRSGELFAYVLGYLQSGHWLLRDRCSDMQLVDALRDEARFYGLDSSKDRYPNPRTSEYATVWQFREDTSIYVDCIEQTIREDPDHQGLFRLCKYFGSLSLDQQTGIKRFKATSHSVQSVIAYFAIRGFVLQHVVEGPMITHTTSADGQSRSGHSIQYMLSRFTTGLWTRSNSKRVCGEQALS